MNRLFDLRFVIGAFFVTVGLLLLVYGFLTPDLKGSEINRWSGASLLLFGGVMVLLSMKKSSGEAGDDVIGER